MAPGSEGLPDSPEVVGDYLTMVERFQELERLIKAGGAVPSQILTEHQKALSRLPVKREELREYVSCLGNPATKIVPRSPARSSRGFTT